jgi:hypothetical protein
MLEDPIPVIIGGTTLLCPPMPFYCLERAWPHIQRLGRMGALTEMLQSAQSRLSRAANPEEHAAAEATLTAAQTLIEREGADFVGQTREAIHIIAAALALESPAPSYDSLSRLVKPDEFVGIHRACSDLMDSSGLTRAAPGEVGATARMMPAQLNGAGSSLN